MKQITFNYFRRLMLMLLAVVGFTTSTLAQDWEEIVHKPLTSTTEEGLVNGTDRELSNFISPSQIGPSLNLSAGASNSDNYIAIKSNSIEEGTYKFSYKIFPLGNSGNIHFFYCKEGDEANKNEVLVSSLSSLSTTSATVIETPEFKISEAGTYLFGWHCDTFGADIYFCDFYLYKKAESSTTTFTVNFDNNENVTIEVTDANGNTINSGDPVEADTEITITPTAAPGYKVKTVYANGTRLTPKPESVDGQMIMRYKTTVTESTEITVETSIIQYTVSAEAVTNGSIALYNTTDLDTPLENNTKLTAGNQVKVVATPNPDYKLARVYYKYSGYNYESEAIEITDNGEGYIFTVGPDPESANTAIYIYAEFVEDTPAETWSEVHFNTMSGKDVDFYNDPYYMNPAKSWSKVNSGATVTGDKNNGLYIKQLTAGYYLAYKYRVEKEATYRFSFVHKKGETKDITVKLCYTKDLESTFTDASAATEIPKKGGGDSGDLFQSNNVVLEPGDYYFVYYIETAATGDIKVRIADFKLEMLEGSAVEPTKYTVTLNKPENGNLSVTYNNGSEDVTVSTDTEAQTFDVAEGTKLTVTVIPAEGYQLATLSPEMTKVEESENVYEYTVTEAATIEATFEKVFEKYAQDFGRGIGDTGWGYRSWENTVFTTSTDGSKTIDVDYITNVNSYDIYSDEFVNESDKVTVYQGESFEITINGGMNWLYTKAYIDWNGDGIFDEDVDGTENLGYNPAKEREFGDDTPTKENTRTYTITVPENATVGDTRVRIILGWKQENIDLIPDDEEKVAKYITSTTIDDKKNAMVRDFSMNIKEKEAAPEFNITVKRPANGSLFIEYTVNGETQEIDTYAFENDSEVFSIPENTVMNIYPTAEYDYELDQILPAGMEEKTDLRGRKYYVLTVTEDATIEATFKAIQYGNVAVTEPEETQGSIEIEFKNPMNGEWQVADDFYLGAVVFGTELRAKVEAKTGYTLKSVMKNGSAIDKNADGYYYFTVDAEAITISAEFEQEQGTYYTITIDVTKPEQGSVKVETQEGQTVDNGDKVKENTELTITPEANEGYIFTTLLIDNKPVQLTDGSYKMTVTKNTKIAPKFKEEATSFELNWVEPENGTLKLYKTSDLENPLTQKSSIEVGTEIKVVVEENEGYDISKVYYKYFPTEKTVDIAKGENGYVFTVEADNENPNNSIIYVYAEIEPETYTLTTEVTPAEGGSVSVTVDYEPVEETVKYGDVITVTVKENTGYIHENTVVEGAEKVEGQAGKYTVKGNVTITVTFKKDTSSINSIENGTVYYNAEEEVLYTGNAVSVKVYDMSGRLVLNTENQETVSLAELADGIYTAVIDGKVIKLNK